MLIDNTNYADKLFIPNKFSYLSLDTETTGLYPYLEDKLFSIIIADETQEYYFNFNELTNDPIPRSRIPHILNGFAGTLFMHNAKFDMAFLMNEGLNILRNDIHCTMAIARCIENDRMLLSLDSLAKTVGHEKQTDVVKDYMKENKLFKGTGKDKKWFYDQVPLDIMVKYAEMDARITYDLGLKQKERVHEIFTSMGESKFNFRSLVNAEKRLTKTLFKIESNGVPVNLDYARQCLEYEESKYTQASNKFKEITGVEFKDSNKLFAEIFKGKGLLYPKTEKGNPSFKAQVLENMTHPVVDCIKEYRIAYKRCTFYKSFLKFADSKSYLHPVLNQAGTKTGRMSSSNPNLQQLEKVKKSEDKYLIRRCFQAPKGYKIVSMDYDQFEYRMMLNYAGQMSIIKRVRAGEDIHTATAKLLNIPRDGAKTVNFMLLYGGGVAVLAMKLFGSPFPEYVVKGIQKDFLAGKSREHIQKTWKVTREQLNDTLDKLDKAFKIRKLYFFRMKEVASLIKNVTKKAEKSKVVVGKFGRRFVFTNPDFAFKAPNYLIQGSTADWVKRAMNRVDSALLGYKTKMILQVHDQIDFLMPETELHLIPTLKYQMERGETRFLPYTVGVSIGDNMQDQEEWIDDSEEMDKL